MVGKSSLVYGRWFTGTLRQMYCKIDELGSSRVSRDQPGSKSNGVLNDSNENHAETRENNIQSNAEMNRIKGMKQHHSRSPPVSLRVDTKVYAGSSGCPTSWYLTTDAF